MVSLCLCLGSALLEGFLFEPLCHENGFWSLAVFWLFFAVFCLCFCLGPALVEGFLFETLCHENGSSLSSGVWLPFGCFS